ncbi:hypothetical protein MKI84_08790 [Ancylobacter sp. A5.8]|uniref:hypothetical protein n=1 Tax=Ancylobacter gelatini TaxID=2919920 RepID=UPI001F4EE8BE|nr:hypothetical protein [Ancylobacter gelatini]MCJ8143012.1 hypothetical protein [Ancylobacter gelatini]
MPRHVLFLLRHALIGCALAVLFVGGLIAFDVARLGELVLHSSNGLLAALVLTVALAITFGSVQMGFAVMLLGEDDETGGRRQMTARPALVPVRVRSRDTMIRRTPRRID